MANIFHLSAMIIALLAYIFSDVNSSSSFTNVFLPFIVLLSFIYGLLVTINMLNSLRKKNNSQDKSTHILLTSIKELKEKELASKKLESKKTGSEIENGEN